MAATLIPYLMFNGNCETAMQFYAEVFKGEIFSVMRYAEGDMPVAEEYKQKIMHCELQAGEKLNLMAADSTPDQGEYKPGNAMTLMVDFEEQAEQDRVYGELSKDGHVVLPIQKMFWGARFGMVTDKYGFMWQLHYTLPQG